MKNRVAQIVSECLLPPMSLNFNRALAKLQAEFPEATREELSAAVIEEASLSGLAVSFESPDAESSC
jgi:hypothetical protein